MKYIDHSNKQFVKYIHIYKTVEVWGYYLKNYPQIPPEELKDWQFKELMKVLEQEAKENNWCLRH